MEKNKNSFDVIERLGTLMDGKHSTAVINLIEFQNGDKGFSITKSSDSESGRRTSTVILPETAAFRLMLTLTNFFERW